MNILITGGNGFIGARYLEHLSQRADVNLSWCARSQRDVHWAQTAHAHFFQGDLLDVPFVNHICRNMDVVVHCASEVCGRTDYDSSYRGNVVTTENLIAACQHAGVQRLVNLSTAHIYFEYRDRLNIAEDFLPERFAGNFARTKYQAERRVALAHSDSLRTLSLRPWLVVGRGDQWVLPHVLEWGQRGVMRRVGGCRNIISLTSADNLMHALDCAVFGADSVYGDVYNIADPQPARLWDVIETVLERAGYPPPQGQTAEAWARMLGWANDCWRELANARRAPALTSSVVSILTRSMTLNIERARRKLGYRPADELERTLESFCAWWLQNNETLMRR